MTITWNPADQGPDIVLSNGNLTAAVASGSWQESVRATISRSSGKWYWEVTLADANALVGVANASAIVTNTAGAFTGNANGLGYFAGNGNIIFNQALVGNAGTGGAGVVIGIAYDADLGTVKFYKNNVLGATITGANVPTGALFPAVGNQGVFSVTANFGATALTYAPPAGYTALGISNDFAASMPPLTIDSGTNDVVQAFPALLLDASGFTEPGFAGVLPAMTSAALAEVPPYLFETLPALTLASNFATSINAQDMSLPVLSLSATVADVINLSATLPLLTVASAVVTGEASSVSETLPAFTLSSETGPSCDLSMPPLGLDTTVVTGELLTLGSTLPMMLVDGVAYQTETWVADQLNVPALTCAANIAQGNTATVAESLPVATSDGTILSGSASTLLEVLPLLTSTGTAYGDSVNTMAGTLPALTMLASAVAAVSTALGNAWVLNLRNSALTEYTNYGFNSMTLFNGKYIGASDAGIVELGTLGTASGDAGTQIDAYALTGSMDSDSSFMKRAPYLYVQCASDGDIVVSKISAEHGQRDFLLPWSGRTGMQQRRVKTGRKSKSEYWQWQFANRLGSYLRVTSFDAMAQRTGRRVQ